MRQLILFSLLILSIKLSGQNQNTTTSTLITRLSQEGMEMIQCTQTDSIIFLSFEDRVDKQPWLGLISVLRICEQENIENTIHTNLLFNGIPRICMLSKAKEIFSITAATDQTSLELAKTEITNKTSGKLLITAFPVIILNNSRTDVIFRVTAGIAPTLQMQVWKGADVTAQVIFPIYNSLENQFDYIRPGIIALTQQFKIKNKWLIMGSIGNFTNQRAGIHASARYDLISGRWGIALDAGLTGSSTSWDGKWQFSAWKRADAFLSSYYYFPKSNTKIEAEAGRYTMGDYGVRGSLSRRFRNVTISLYGMYSDGEVNGGFNFIIPLAFTKLKKIKPISLVWPKWYDWEYSAQSGPEYTTKHLGQTYRTRLYERAEDSYWNPSYIKSQIIHFFNTK